jgi:hypothetical protein
VPVERDDAVLRVPAERVPVERDVDLRVPAERVPVERRFVPVRDRDDAVPVRARLVEALRVPVDRFRVEREADPARDAAAGIAGSTVLGDSSLRSNGVELVAGSSGDSLGVWGVSPHPS